MFHYLMKNNNNMEKFRFSSWFGVEVSHHKQIRVVAKSFGDVARKVSEYLSRLETKDSHEIISIVRFIDDVLI